MKVPYVLTVILMIVLIIFLGAKTVETVINCFIAVNQTAHSEEGEPVAIDMGSAATDRSNNIGGDGSTVILQDNPANEDGTITEIQIYAASQLTGVKIALFYNVTGTNFSTRSTVTIGTVEAGYSTHVVNLAVVAGDYLGIHWDTGNIEADWSGGSAYWYAELDAIPCTNQEFTDVEDDDVISLYGVGADVVITSFIPQYKNIDCSLLVDDNESGAFFGVRIPCELEGVNRDVVEACVNTSQGIRVVISVNGEDVSDSLIGQIQISHNLNYVSTFQFSLCDPKYSPLVDANIKMNAVVIITVYINGQQIKMFTGLVDETRTTYDGGYRLTITGRDYGKKLLDTTKTLISVQESAQRKYRGSIVKYLAGQAGQSSVNIPLGDRVNIDHSFQDQNIWDMVQKECAIEGWQVRHDENGVMQVKTKSLKTTADWEYGEDKFVQLGLETSDKGIINKVIILGAIFEEEVITVEVGETEQQVEVPTEEYQENTTTLSKSFSQGEVVSGTIAEDSNFRVTGKYIGYTAQPGLPFNPYQNYGFTLTKLNSDITITNVDWSATGQATTIAEKRYSCEVRRETGSIGGLSFQEGAFALTITIKTKELVAGGSVWITENIPTETTVSTITYTQVKATVTDTNSIALYGERKPNNEGTLEFPLAETEAQCKRIGENVILDSHRFIKQPDFRVPFNPKLIVGCTVELNDKKIGYDEDEYLVEEAIHYIDIDKEGKMKARTRIGCVFYA